MKITPEELELFKNSANFDVDRPASLGACTDYFSACGLLMAHIDVQAVRIASTDAMLTEAVEALRLSEKELEALADVAGSNAARVKELERELEALRNDVSTWETMRKANGLPDTVGATILLAASLRQELAALREQKPVEYRVLSMDGAVAANCQTETEARACVSRWNREWVIQPVFEQPVPAAPVAVPPIKLPTTTLWANSVPCYSRDDIIAVLTKYGLEVQDGV